MKGTLINQSRNGSKLSVITDAVTTLFDEPYLPNACFMVLYYIPLCGGAIYWVDCILLHIDVIVDITLAED